MKTRPERIEVSDSWISAYGESGSIFSFAGKGGDAWRIGTVKEAPEQRIGLRCVWDEDGSAPVVTGLEEAGVHDGVESRVLFDEDLTEGAVLAEEDGLEAHQFQ